MNLDKLNNASVSEAGEAMYSLLGILEDKPTEVQLLAPALLLRIMADVLRVDLQKVFTTVSNMEHNKAYGQAQHFAAMRDYVKGELT